MVMRNVSCLIIGGENNMAEIKLQPSRNNFVSESGKKKKQLKTADILD